MDGKTNTMIMLQPSRKQYTKSTISDFCGSTKAMVDSAMENVPPEYRQMMEQMMGKQGKAAPEVSISKAGDGETVAGFKTTKYKVMVNGALYEEVWVSDDTALQKDWQPLAPMMKEFEACTAAMAEIGSPSPETSPKYQALMEKGLPLKTIRYQNGEKDTVTDVMKIEKNNIPDAEFKTPKGYSEVPLSSFMGDRP